MDYITDLPKSNGFINILVIRLMPCNRNQLRVFFRLSSLSDRMVFMSGLYFFFLRGIKFLRTRRFSASVPCVFIKYGKDLPGKLSCRYMTRTYPEYASVRSVQSIWNSVRCFFTCRAGGHCEHCPLLCSRTHRLHS